jgi:hypothetical protein
VREVEGHVVGFGLDGQTCEHLHQLFFDYVVFAAGERLPRLLPSLFEEAEAALDLKDRGFVVPGEGLEAGEEHD